VQTRVFGSTAVRVPVIGQGTFRMESDDRREAVRAVRAGLDAGAMHIDTAEMYGDGRVEEILAEALAGRRDEVFLVSKVLPENASRQGTLRACERSLARLRSDRLDCYLLHWLGEHPLEDTFAAFEELLASGKILSWGVSNFDDRELEQAVRLVGPGRIACNQVLYHLEDRQIERALLPLCEKYGVALVGYTPFGDRFPKAASPGGRALAEIAAAHGATPRQVALAFLTRKPALFAIPKAARPPHARENAAAADLSLSAGDVARIEAAFPLGKRKRRLGIL
jgi:diketogulonate reductase-like aldo/keto reductase